MRNEEIERTKSRDAVIVRTSIIGIVMSHEHVIQIHGFYYDKSEMMIRFDFVVSFNAPDRYQVYKEVCEAVQKEYPDYMLQVTMDTDFSEE